MCFYFDWRHVSRSIQSSWTITSWRYHNRIFLDIKSSFANVEIKFFVRKTATVRSFSIFYILLELLEQQLNNVAYCMKLIIVPKIY